MNKNLLILAFCLVVAFGLVTTVGIAGPKGLKACKDTIDNDGDGYTDWPDDPGCANKNDNSELNPSIECDDGSDNDGDSDTDMDDSGCSSPTDDDETDCGDAVCEGGEVCDVCVADCGHCDSCSETDFGNNIWIFSATSGYYNDVWYSDDDYCVDSGTIMEYYCVGDYEQSQQQSCGTDYYTGNYCYDGDVYRDHYDYYCASGECDYTLTPELVEECDWGCINATCQLPPDSCSDTDGGFVIDVLGTVSGYDEGSPYSHPDYCVDSTNIMEYYCVSDQYYSQSVECWINNQTASCVDGACTL